MTSSTNKDGGSAQRFAQGIMSVTLGGFRVFDTPTTIPFAPITLLFGPNSAGKSAVQSAILLVAEAVKEPGVGWNHGRFESFLKHNWRVSGSEWTDFAPTMHFGIEVPIDPIEVGDESIGMSNRNRFQERLIEHTASVYFDLHYRFDKDHPYCDFWIDQDLRVAIDLIDIFHYVAWRGFALNLSHPLFKGKEWGPDVNALSTHTGLENGWLWILDPDIALLKEDSSLSIDISRIENVLRQKKNRPELSKTSLSNAVAKFVSLGNSVIQQIIKKVKIQPDLVPASRTVPSPTDLCHLVTGLSDWELKGENPLELFGLIQKPANRYFDLATSFVRAQLPGSTSPGFDCADRSLSEKVNNALSKSLFVETGYQVEADFLWLLDRTDLNSVLQTAVAGQDSETPTGKYPVIVRMYLKDTCDRKLSFENVGSGLGYVLPVLCSVFHPDVSISLVQQPELHLHPGLQTAMGDVLIDAASQQKQLVIETHSEHMLLRILKRVRQSSSGQEGLTSRRISAKHVSIVYFNPNHSGGTEVKRLRVDNEGEFMDRWPRGFFVERDGELFDE